MDAKTIIINYQMPNDQGLATLRLVLKAGNEVLNQIFTSIFHQIT